MRSLRGSLAFSGEAKTTVPTATPTSLRASYNTGGGGSVYIGTRLPLGFRIEAEALYRYLPFNQVNLAGTPSVAKGQASIGAPPWSICCGTYRFPDFPFLGFPFIGAGIGGAYTSSVDRCDDPANANTYLTTHRFAPAYQFMGGAEVPLSQSSRFTAMYRWLQVDGLNGGCNTSGSATLFCKSNINTQSVDLGLEMDL